jgi:hypothetical protein
MKMPELTEARRAWIYRVSLAVLPMLVAAGFLTSNNAPYIIGLLGAILNAGLATAHTSTENTDA